MAVGENLCRACLGDTNEKAFRVYEDDQGLQARKDRFDPDKINELLCKKHVGHVKTLYELYNLDVKIYFEKENLNNFDKELRTMMGIYAGFAQEESKNMSDNIKWGIRERMREGKVCLNCTRFLGYEKDENGKLVIVESEAAFVRRIFELYLNGFGVRKIKKYLEENGIKTVTGKDVWSTSTIDRILSNEKYVGDVLMQKSFTENFLTGKRKKNEGELAMYFIENDHEAIISRDIFTMVQEMKKEVNEELNRFEDVGMFM